MSRFIYYLPELDLLAESESHERQVFVVYIYSLELDKAFDAVLLGEL